MHLALANPCENTIWETLLKVYLFLAPPLLLACCRIGLLSLVILEVFTLFIITILKPIVRACFLSSVCPKCFTIQVCQPVMIYKASYTDFQVQKIIFNLPALVLPTYSPVSSRCPGYPEITECEQH